MTLRSLIASRGRLLPDLYVQRSPQQRERAVSFDPAEAWLDVQQGRGEPAVFLVRGAPPGDLVDPLRHEGVDRFEAVGGLQAPAQLLEDAQPVERERLLQALLVGQATLRPARQPSSAWLFSPFHPGAGRYPSTPLLARGFWKAPSSERLRERELLGTAEPKVGFAPVYMTGVGPVGRTDVL